GGASANTPVALHNVANGLLSASSTDAVNGQQLFATNQAVTNLQGDVTNINGKLADAVMYDSSAHDSVTLGGVGSNTPAVLHNVATGVAPTDAVNVAQMNQAVITGNPYISGFGSGAPAQATVAGAVALGLGSVANTPYTISVGDASNSLLRRITNVATGVAPTDAATVAQLGNSTTSMLSTVDNLASNTQTALQAVSNRLGTSSYSVGGTTVNTVSDAIASLDSRLQKNTAEIAALAADSSTSTQEAVESASNSAPASSATQMVAASRSPLGASAGTATANYAATPVGDAPANTTDADAVHYDSADHSSVTLASATGGNVSLSGLSNGTLSLDSTDAVTGQQLYATNQQVASINQALQNINIAGTTATSVNSTSGVAAASGTQSIAVGGGAVATGASSTAIGDKANASANNSVAIGANSIANRDNAVSVGAEGSERQIVNVAAGTSGTDAVNLNQLNDAMTQQSNAFGQQIGNLQNSINTVSKNAYAGVAAAMAMPNLTPSGPGRTVVAAGGGYYMGGSAAAIGVTYRSMNMHWLVNGGVSVTSTGNTAARAQVGYEF
ncbi:YadA family autotransporter adhesin, partial [Paraburkholderia sp. J63]|uniref:YadA family autotransporter adhesin n=1 Tax=Paraburkholderia sp. J63 TaxID=2805434 RepID=UPI002ABDA339